MSSWEVPGAAVVIVGPDRVIHLKGYGRRALTSDQRVTPDTIFPLASCTKAFTATLLAMLVDEGKVRWDDHVRDHLPDFHLADPLADSQVTLRDLLTHRTGLGSHDYLWYRSPLPQGELVRRVGRLPLERPFRTAFQYQSILYSAAGLAAGHAAGARWEDMLHARLFQPLGMQTARAMTPTREQAADLATPHRADRDGRLREIAWYVQTAPNPAGSVHASARDLAAWLQFQLGAGSFRGRQLVAATSLGETHSPQFALRMEGPVRFANPDTLQMSYGMGWVIQDFRGRLLVSHAGTLDGFRAHITLMPRDGFALAILCNRHQTRMNLALSNMLVDRLLELPRKDWHAHFKELVQREEQAARAMREQRERARRAGTRPSRPLADYAGAYEHPAYGRAVVRAGQERLEWEWSGFRGPLVHYHFDTFAASDDDLTDPLIEFSLAPGGAVTGFTFLNLPFPRVEP